MNGIKVILDNDGTRYIKGGEQSQTVPVSWRKNVLDKEALLRGGYRARILVGERIGDISDVVEDNGLSVDIVSPYSDIRENFETNKEIGIYFNILKDGQQIDTDFVDTNIWYINNKEISKESVLNISINDLVNKKNNIIKVECNYNGDTTSATTQIFVFMPFDNTGDDDGTSDTGDDDGTSDTGDDDDDGTSDTGDDEKINFTLSPKEIIYNGNGNLITTNPVGTISVDNVDGDITYSFYVDSKDVQSGDDNIFNFTGENIPIINENKIIRMVVLVNGKEYKNKKFKLYSSVDFDKLENRVYQIEEIFNPSNKFKKRFTVIGVNDKNNTYFDVNDEGSATKDYTAGGDTQLVNNIENITWDFGDGSKTSTGNIGSKTSTGNIVEHTYEESKKYVVEVTITFVGEDSRDIIISKVIKIDD